MSIDRKKQDDLSRCPTRGNEIKMGEKLVYSVYCTYCGEKYRLKASESKEAIIDWISVLLSATKKYSLMANLNEIQIECGGADPKSPFFNKYEFPLIIINLVLKGHGIWVEERIEKE